MLWRLIRKRTAGCVCQHRSPWPWGCRWTAWLDRIGHDGSQIVNSLPEPLCRRGFHPQEFMDLCLDQHYAVTRIELMPPDHRGPWPACPACARRGDRVATLRAAYPEQHGPSLRGPCHATSRVTPSPIGSVVSMTPKAVSTSTSAKSVRPWASLPRTSGDLTRWGPECRSPPKKTMLFYPASKAGDKEARDAMIEGNLAWVKSLVSSFVARYRGAATSSMICLVKAASHLWRLWTTCVKKVHMEATTNYLKCAVRRALSHLADNESTIRVPDRRLRERWAKGEVMDRPVVVGPIF